MRTLEKILAFAERFFVIPRLALILTLGSVTCFLLAMVSPGFLPFIAFVPAWVFQGEIWRLISFIFYPFALHPIFALFTYYLFFMMGSAMEREWGAARFNLFIFSAYLLTLLFACLTPGSAATNYYIYLSVYLAFAALYPDMELYLFFVLPVRMKWLAWIVAALTLLEFAVSGSAGRLAILAAALNLLLFFGPGWVRGFRGRIRSARFESRTQPEEIQPFHTCAVCGANERTHPQAVFRILNGQEYCSAHLPPTRPGS